MTIHHPNDLSVLVRDRQARVRQSFRRTRKLRRP